MKQIHREAPTQALTYWTLDGWDAELFYQKKTPKTVKKNGEENRYMYTTYTNRKTMVVVLDACENIRSDTPLVIMSHPRLSVKHYETQYNIPKSCLGNAISLYSYKVTIIKRR